MKGHLKIKLIAVFFVALFVSLLALQGLTSYLRVQYESESLRQHKILIENVNEKFKFFLRIPVALGITGAQYFSSRSLKEPVQKIFSEKLLGLNKEILGLNILDKKGRIVRVFPSEGINEKALGLITQNIRDLETAYRMGDRYWFSPPFRLFQGVSGFALYFPIVSPQKELKGWLATVLSTENFVKNFNINHFLNVYDLIILDQDTELTYFSSGLGPSGEEKVFESVAEINGRSILFKSWKKNSRDFVTIPVSWRILVSICLAILITFLFRLISLKHRLTTQLSDVSTLLKLTSKEAHNRLVDLQQEFYKVGASESMSYLAHLIEQVDLLQTTANTKKEIGLDQVELLPAVMNELSEIKDMIARKSIMMNVIPEQFKSVTVLINDWFFKNSILNNVLTYSVTRAAIGTGVSIEYKEKDEAQEIIVHIQQLFNIEEGEELVVLERRLQVTRKVLNLFRGDLRTNKDLAGGMIITLHFKKQPDRWGIFNSK